MVEIDQDRLRGQLVDANRKRERDKAIRQIADYQQRADTLEISLAGYMGGMSIDHIGGRKLDYSLTLNTLSIERVSLFSTFATTIRVPGIDYQSLQTNPNRVKYYCSFKDDIPLEQEQRFLSALITQAIERGISIQLKNQDHNYDGLNIYSWDPKMADLLIELFHNFKDIFLSVPRIFHGTLTDEADGSIGWVQEPLSVAYVNRENSGRLGAHTDRMGKLGALLSEREITDQEYIEACKEVGVRPEKPYLLNQELFVNTPEGK